MTVDCRAVFVDSVAVMDRTARERRRFEMLRGAGRERGRRSSVDRVRSGSDALPEVVEGHVDAASALNDCSVARVLLMKTNKNTK